MDSGILDPDRSGSPGLLGWARPAPLELEWVHPGRGDLVSTVVNTRAGTIKSCQRAGPSLPGGGIVEQIRVVAGEKVSKGQPLLTLWNEDLKAELARARATAVLNRVLREQSCVDANFKAREAKRLITLRERNLTSKTLSEQAESLAAHSRLACEAAASQSSVDEAQIAAAEARLSQSRVARPFAGVVAEVNSKLGEFMTPSPPGITMPPVIDLIDDSCLYVSAPIDEVTPGCASGNRPPYCWMPCRESVSPPGCGASPPMSRR